MRGYAKLKNFLAFSVFKSLSPTICDSPLSQLGEGFQILFGR